MELFPQELMVTRLGQNMYWCNCLHPDHYRLTTEFVFRSDIEDKFARLHPKYVLCSRRRKQLVTHQVFAD